MAAIVRPALLLSAVMAVCQTGLAWAEYDYQVTRDSQSPAATGATSAAALAQPVCCGEYGEYRGTGWPGGPCQVGLDERTQSSRPVWTIDYRVRPMFDSNTSYQFGTVPDDPDGPYAPLSKLDFALDSTWHGFQIGVEKLNWRIHFEWLTPIRQNIDGDLADYDWNIDDPRNDPGRLDSLTLSPLRWHDGQMLDLGAEFKLADRLFNLPVEIWPAAGFRFQRFDMTASGLTYLVPSIGVVPELNGVDVITFNQQYYVGYFGGQLRTTLVAGRIPIDVRFQGDAGPTAGYNVDHHLLREGHRFTMEKTSGVAWHIALIFEAPITRCFSLGIQADHTEIRTTGTHRLLNVPLEHDLTWENGVAVKSDQTSLTAFVRARF